MKRKFKIIITLSAVLLTALLIEGGRHNSFFTPFVFAHCDTLDGPVVLTAKAALKNGDAVSKGIREKFAHAKETRKNADKSVEAGREYVEAYVVYTHYVERLFDDATAKVEHRGEVNTAAHRE